MHQVAPARESLVPPLEPPALPESAPRTPGLHLFVDALAPGASLAPRTAAELPLLEVPAGVSYLAPCADPLALSSLEPCAPALVFEPIRVAGGPRLLVLTPAALRARINGQAAPAVALLKIGDQLQLDGRAVLHLSEYRGAGTASPPAELVGRPCAVCRLPIAADTRITTCGTCALPFHLEGPPTPEGERLECALFGDCPGCASAIHTTGGHVWTPEL